MSRHRRLGVRVLKAVSSPLRLQILNLLFDRGPLSYTEIMGILRLSPSRDAGRFAYHLKSLLKTDLIEPDVKTKKYRLTDLGRMIVGVTESIEERVFRRRKMMFRTSRLAMEEFDRNKIAESLTREAGVPIDLAQKIARGTKEQPFYTDMIAVSLNTSFSWKERLSVEGEFHKLSPGGHLAVLQLADSEQDPSELLSATKHIVRSYSIGLYTYSRNLAYCAHCQNTFYGIPPKCPVCGSINRLTCFSRTSAKYLPASRWAPAQRLALGDRASYVLF